LDKVFVRQLEVKAVIGIWEWEQRVTQIVRVDIEMACDVRRAAATDSIDAAVNYRSVAKRLREFIEASRFRLVETLAEACAAIVIREFGVAWVRISLAKPAAVNGSREVGVVIERRRADFDA
jgi:dihydroneopterin aldolase